MTEEPGKAILIERVVNGWIVRPFQASPEWARGERCQMWVYEKIEDLQAQLPKLLGVSKPPLDLSTLSDSCACEWTPEAKRLNEFCPVHGKRPASATP